MEEIMVTICTVVYNTKQYIKECIDSVINQTYSNFEYIIIDNGCNDGTSEILEKYAALDKRIKLVSFTENKKNIAIPLLQEICRGKYFSFLDSDDWWEPEYLEKLVAFAEENNLDIAFAGTCIHNEKTKESSYENVDASIVLSEVDMVKDLSRYSCFLGAIWGKLIRIELIHNMDFSWNKSIYFGNDTIYCYQLLRCAKKVGIDNSALYHYRIHKKSIMNQYDPGYMDANFHLSKYLKYFMESMGVVNEKNITSMQGSFNYHTRQMLLINNDTVLSPQEVLQSCYRLVNDTSNQEFYSYMFEHHSSTSLLWFQTMISAIAESGESDSDFSDALDAISAYCGTLGDGTLRREHEQICRLLADGNNTAALEKMADILRTEEDLYSTKIFVKGFLILAEKEERQDLVYLGKLRLAEHYFKRGNEEKSRTLLRELSDSGYGEEKEVIALIKELKA